MQVIKFGAPWCGPCKMYDPVLAQVSGEFPEVSFNEVNIDELDRDTLADWGILSVPMTVFLTDSGELVDEVQGPIPPPRLRAILAQ